MYKLVIEGGTKLFGSLTAEGAKNSALPLLAATLLASEKITLNNMPHLSDVRTMLNLLKSFGAKVEDSELVKSKIVQLHTPKITSTLAPYEIVSTMRASVIVLGALLAREGIAEISLPGGCAIGDRPINYHLEAFEKMGAKITLEEGYIKAEGKLKGAEINFPIASVGATENVIIAATLAEGTTTIYNAAREPEIEDLAEMLNKMGAKITGAGSSKVQIIGVTKLAGCSHKVISDRIEAGSYLVAGIASGGSVKIDDIKPEYLDATIATLEAMNAKIETTEDSIKASYNGEILPTSVVTRVHPGFPTDMQAQISTLMCLAKGTSTLEESIFENRFMHIPELNRMGANITIDGKKIFVNGIERFRAAEVMATDLRASFSLVIAALNAKGTTSINRLYHLDRGYSHIEEKLDSLGGKAKRIQAQ